MDEQDIEKAILKRVYLWLVAGGLALGGVAGMGGFRPDPFTGTDAEFLRQEVMFHCKELELNIRKDMPPFATRKRIRDIERCLEVNCSDFQVKEYGW